MLDEGERSGFADYRYDDLTAELDDFAPACEHDQMAVTRRRSPGPGLVAGQNRRRMKEVHHAHA